MYDEVLAHLKANHDTSLSYRRGNNIVKIFKKHDNLHITLLDNEGNKIKSLGSIPYTFPPYTAILDTEILLRNNGFSYPIAHIKEGMVFENVENTKIIALDDSRYIAAGDPTFEVHSFSDNLSLSDNLIYIERINKSNTLALNNLLEEYHSLPVSFNIDSRYFEIEKEIKAIQNKYTDSFNNLLASYDISVFHDSEVVFVMDRIDVIEDNPVDKNTFIKVIDGGRIPCANSGNVRSFLKSRFEGYFRDHPEYFDFFSKPGLSGVFINNSGDIDTVKRPGDYSKVFNDLNKKDFIRPKVKSVNYER